MFPSVEIRHLRAVIALAEELNIRRAADRLHITQPALSKQITDLEAEHRFHLFTRDKRRIVELTDAGRVFVEEARSALSQTERTVRLARAAHEGSDSILTIGHSPFANHGWVSAMLAIRLPLYPRLGIRLKTQFAMESVHSVLVGEVNLALVTAPRRMPRSRLCHLLRLRSTLHFQRPPGCSQRTLSSPGSGEGRVDSVCETGSSTLA